MSIYDSIVPDAIEQLVRDAGTLALEHFHRLSSISVQSKGHLDLVTAADQEVERFLTERLHKVLPNDGIFGEEGSSVTGKSGRIWVVDPIDGTFNFVRGGDQWAISVGLYQGGRPEFGVIHAPARHQTLIGGRNLRPTLNGQPLDPTPALVRSRAVVGVSLHPSVPTPVRLAVMRFIMDDARMSFRFCGSATISLLELAVGQVDGYVGLGLSTWDVMAALPILSQLGVENTVDWSQTNLSSKLKFASGSREFLDIIAPALVLLR